MMTEQWKFIDEGGWIQVSSLGRVRSWRNGRYGLRQEPRILPANPDGTGYRSFGLKPGDGRHLRLRVHRLVCEAFNGPPPFPGAVVRHLDGDPLNNRAVNLAWGTMRDNSLDMVRHGRSMRGERSPQARLTAEQVLEIRRLWGTGPTQQEIGKMFGISRRHVRDIVRGERWGHVA